VEPVLAVRGLSKRFGGVVAVDDVDLEVADGELLGLIGPNGSGKTTLVNCVTGVLRPTAGSVVFDSRDVTEWPRPRRARAGLLRTFQNLRLFAELTVAENVQVGGSTQRGPVDVEGLLRKFHLTPYARRPVRDLPYGFQRRVEIARALAGRPRLLLLDEPAAGLSETEKDGLADELLSVRRELGTSMLVIDHDMAFMMRVCERMVALHEGRTVFSGTPDEVLAHRQVVESYLGGIVSEVRA
jgi:ABC-type branched-subunit amino acid transport system ATPase component